MKAEHILEALNGVDDRYIEEAAQGNRKRGTALAKIMASAACLVLVSGIGLFALMGSMMKTREDSSSVSMAKDNGDVMEVAGGMSDMEGTADGVPGMKEEAAADEEGFLPEAAEEAPENLATEMPMEAPETPEDLAAETPKTPEDPAAETPLEAPEAEEADALTEEGKESVTAEQTQNGSGGALKSSWVSADAGEFTVFLKLPEGYAAETSDAGDLAAEDAKLRIAFWSVDEPDAKFRLEYVENFGLCGTGVSVEVKEMESGRKLTVYTEEQDGEVWLSVVVGGVDLDEWDGTFVLMAGVEKAVWEQRRDGIFAILSGIKVEKS